jgi:hypothetical protein
MLWVFRCGFLLRGKLMVGTVNKSGTSIINKLKIKKKEEREREREREREKSKIYLHKYHIHAELQEYQISSLTLQHL